MSLTNPNKVITEQRLSEFYGEILPYLGGMPELLGNKISRGDLYSTTEKIIGQWIDSKPIYQKTVNIGALPNKSTKTIAHEISNLDKVIYYYGNASNGSDRINLPYVSQTKDDLYIPIWITATQINIACSSWDASSYSGYLTIQYTKTTDSAQAVGVDTDYSTTEKIVGTWIDGKPLYQKTVQMTVPNATTDGTEVSASVSLGATIDKIIAIEAIDLQSGGGARTLQCSSVANDAFRSVRIYAYTNEADSANRNKIFIGNSWTSHNGATIYATIKYTKN